jgi:hypothetical protein
LKLLPEACNELCPSIRDDHLRDTMQMNNLIKIDFGILLSSISCMHREKMCYFGESINDYPDRVMFLRCVGKANDETDVFPLPNGIGSGWSVPDTFR